LSQRDNARWRLLPELDYTRQEDPMTDLANRLQTRAKLAQERVNFVERERQGLPPVLHFNYEMMLDGRTRQRAVNYALVRIRTVLGSTGSRRPRVVAAN
jgi:hypothetical protein